MRQNVLNLITLLHTSDIGRIWQGLYAGCWLGVVSHIIAPEQHNGNSHSHDHPKGINLFIPLVRWVVLWHEKLFDDGEYDRISRSPLLGT